MDINVSNLIVSLDEDQDHGIERELLKRGISKSNIKSLIWNRRSLDSRQKNNIKFIYNLDITTIHDIKPNIKKGVLLQKKVVIIKRKPIFSGQVAVVGSGPAGLFAALRLAEYGYFPVIFERGRSIDERDKSTEIFIKKSILDPESNIQFGEGGAGTYSDGKLNTRIKSEYIDKVFGEFVSCGADNSILWDYKPHIGTDVLKRVIKNLREKIISLGGKFYFDTKITNILTNGDHVTGIETLDRSGNVSKYSFDHVILAIGNSSRDTFRMLSSIGCKMISKPFAVGMRIEHLRCDIDKMQYGKYAGHEMLGAATYNVTYNNRSENRGVFSFCMCPGGEVINASSCDGMTLVNGMSDSLRSGRFSNSAIVVGIKENDFGDDIFSGMEFQESIEKKAFDLIGGYGALCQRVIDLINNKKDISFDIDSSYKMKSKCGDINSLFPAMICDNMRSALSYWAKNKYFVNETTTLIGPETRTSSPVRILRDEKGESVSIKGLYPIGEGAGYAGGITSSAVDGIKTVDFGFTVVI